MAPKFQKGPDLKRFMDKRLQLLINGNRKVIGTLRGYDAFLNVVLEDAEYVTVGPHSHSQSLPGQIVIRGNSIVQLEGLERVSTTTAAAAAAAAATSATATTTAPMSAET